MIKFYFQNVGNLKLLSVFNEDSLKLDQRNVFRKEKAANFTRILIIKNTLYNICAFRWESADGVPFGEILSGRIFFECSEEI